MLHWRRIVYVSFAAQVIALIGFSFVYPFLPLYIQTLGVHGSDAVIWTGIISFALSIAMAIVSPFWGVLADRYGRKPMVVRAMTAGVFTTALLIVAPNVWTVLILRILQGALTGSVSATQALVASVVPRERMGFSMGLMQSSVFMGSAVGPLVGGVLDDHLGFHGTFAVGAALLLAAVLLVIFFVDERFERRAASEEHESINPVHQVRIGLATAGLPAMALVLFIAEFGNVVPSPILAFFVPTLHGVPTAHGVPQTSTMVGIILAVAGICAALASWQVGRLTDRYGYRKVLIVATALGGLVYIPACLVTAAWQLIAIRAAVGLCLGLAMPCASAIVGLITPEGRRASAYGLIASASSLGIAFGPLAGSAIGASDGFRAVFPLTGIVFVAVAATVAVTVREPDAPRVPVATAPISLPIRQRLTRPLVRGRK